jgi:hypothetical protein
MHGISKGYLEWIFHLDIDGYLRIYLDKYPWILDMSGYIMDIFSGYLFWISPKISKITKRYPSNILSYPWISFHILGYP